MKIQYISDIHLEHLKVFPIINKVADNLCLLGDIGCPRTQIYKNFIKYCSNNFTNVFVIYGNHEYYSVKTRLEPLVIQTMKEIDDLAKDFPDNVYFLNNSCIYVHKTSNQVKHSLDEIYEEPRSTLPINVGDGRGLTTSYVKIIGSTLWSDIDLDIAKYINDFKRIKKDNEKHLDAHTSKAMFHDNKKYILQEIEKDPEILCIILTHHGTNSICNGEFYKDSPLVSAFVTDIPELLEYKNVLACINGHTHSSINKIIKSKRGNDIHFLANCYGYMGEDKKVVNFDPDAHLVV
jgi:predicted MPP superfamily phosphohydrolase